MAIESEAQVDRAWQGLRYKSKFGILLPPGVVPTPDESVFSTDAGQTVVDLPAPENNQSSEE